MTPERKEKFQKVAARRQGNLTIILENVHDPHNIGAVLRSCDSVGVQEIYVLYTEEHLTPERFNVGKTTSSGARKWIDVHFFRDAKACFEKVREKYTKIYSTHLSKDAKELYELDLTDSVALLFGNEHHGLSEEVLPFSDGNFIIPQVGMVQSLNISVACAVSLYEAYRQRNLEDLYFNNTTTSLEQKENIFNDFCERHERALKARRANKLAFRNKKQHE